MTPRKAPECPECGRAAVQSPGGWVCPACNRPVTEDE